MAKKRSEDHVGSWAFLIGVILAVIFAFFTVQAWVVWALVIIGIIIGLVNIKEEEVKPFMFAGTVFVIVSALGAQVFVGKAFLEDFLSNMLYLFVPATLVVALKSLWEAGRY